MTDNARLLGLWYPYGTTSLRAQRTQLWLFFSYSLLVHTHTRESPCSLVKGRMEVLCEPCALRVEYH